MSNVTSTVRAKLVSATEITTKNLSMPVAGTEYPYTIPDATKQILIRMRTPSECKIAFVSNGTNTEFLTLKPNAVYFKQNLDLNGVIVYLQSNAGSQVAEIETCQ